MVCTSGLKFEKLIPTRVTHYAGFFDATGVTGFALKWIGGEYYFGALSTVTWQPIRGSVKGFLGTKSTYYTKFGLRINRDDCVPNLMSPI